MANLPGQKIIGVYAIWGPAGVYIGQAIDCERRNVEFTKLGVPWGVVVEMPGSTYSDRCRRETATADAWAARGFTVVSCNTSGHLVESARLAGVGAATALTGKPKSAAHIAKMRAAARGKPWSDRRRAAHVRRYVCV